MPIIRDPWDRFFDPATWDPFRLWPSGVSPFAGTEWMPDVDLSESDDSVFVEVDVTGYDTKNVCVDVSGNSLIVTGKIEEREPTGRRWLNRERRHRSAEFCRRISLPDYADVENASCNVKDGILTITVPKKPETATKRLPVNVES
jgi:HSP20 family protein